MSDKKDKSLKDQIAELDALIAWFDQPDFDLDAAVGKFNEGMRLAEAIKERLGEIENKITILKTRFDVSDGNS